MACLKRRFIIPVHLVVQFVNGLMLAQRLMPDFGQWSEFSNPTARLVALKLLLLWLTLSF